jgi:hypothetical protein
VSKPEQHDVTKLLTRAVIFLLEQNGGSGEGATRAAELREALEEDEEPPEDPPERPARKAHRGG